MLTLLFLDDEEARYKKYKGLLRTTPVKITWCVTAKEAITALRKRRYDIISLDHDLGGKGSGFTPDVPGDVPELQHLFGAQVPITEEGPDGLTVAKALVKTANVDSTIIIHSMNQIGSQRMKQVLPRAQIIPFHHVWLEINLIQKLATKETINEGSKVG